MCQICELCLYDGDLSKGAFSTRHCSDMTHTCHAFAEHEQSANCNV